MIKKINLLTKIFLKEYYQNLNIINKKNNKINIKTTVTWLIIILIFAICYLSFNVIKTLKNIGMPILFLKVYLPIIATMMIIQLISLTCRVFYYSKDLEFVIPLPIKTTEILIAKLNTVIIIMYFLEIMFLLVPLLMYGILVTQSIMYFVSMIIILIVFPIFFATIINIIMLFVMKLAKYIKNQDKFQTIIVFTLTFIITFAGMTYGEKIIFEQGPENLSKLQIINIKIDEINKIFFVINPIVNLLENNNYLINLIKIIIINFIPIIIFVLLAKKLYLKNILQNKNVKINTKINTKIKNKIKLKNKTIEYIKKDIRKIIKNPSSFMQLIFPYVFVIFVAIMVLNVFTGTYIDQIKESKILETMTIDDFKFQSILIVVGILQLIFTFCNLSITAISREGNNAYFMKYIPMSLYKQFKLKTLPQIFFNTIVIILILNTIYFKISEIAFYYYIIAFVIAMILNILNSYIMVLIDLKNPNLNWTNEESITKNNKNKLYQYVISICIFLILSYFTNIFEDVKFIISITSIIIILLIVLIFLEKYINKNINKLFKKIN